MTQKCFDEGTIQAFLDGEIASDLAENVACHVALCDDCAAVLANAEDESSFAFATLDAELNALVPTERIRTKLFESIAAEKKTFWQRIFAGGFGWSPHITAFASIALVMMAAVVFLNHRNNSESDSAAQNKPFNNESRLSAIQPQSVVVSQNNTDKNTTEMPRNPIVNTPAKISPAKVVYQPKREVFEMRERAKSGRKNNSGLPIKKPATEQAQSDYAIEGEESYIRTIATLKQTVDTRKDEIMRPSMRVSYERDMAMVNDAIDKMRVEVRKNPKNEAAKDVLRASYQNKIDLLNSFAEKSELMASMK